MSALNHARFRLAAVSGAVVVAALLTGCSGGSVGNGGATTCGEYLELTADQQKQVIKDFFGEKGNSDPSGGEVLLSQQSAKLYCNTLGSASDPISNIDG